MGGRDSAVSSVIATVLLLGVTVTVFAGVSLWVLGEVDERNEKTRADIAVTSNDQAFLLQHDGGDDLELSKGKVLVTFNDGGKLIELEYPLTDWASDVAPSKVDGWEIGETVCISCHPGIAARLASGQSIEAVWVIYGNAVLVSEGQRGLSAGNGDADGDGIPDVSDDCPNGQTGWTSGPATDFDGDGCKDNHSEDTDDDNDGVPDGLDLCPNSVAGSFVNWVSDGTETFLGCKEGAESPGSSLTDVRAGALTAIPSKIGKGDDVLVQLTVHNDDTSAITTNREVLFTVLDASGSVIHSETVTGTGTLAAGTKEVLGFQWTAPNNAGDYTIVARLDPNTSIPGNAPDDDTKQIDVTVQNVVQKPWPPGGAQPFRDNDGNGIYTEGDELIDQSVLESGDYDPAAPFHLVVPKEVSLSQSAHVNYKTESVTIHGTVATNGYKFKLEPDGGGFVNIDGAIITRDGSSTAGAVDDFKIKTSGAISAIRSVIAGDHMDLYGTGTMDFTGATLVQKGEAKYIHFAEKYSAPGVSLIIDEITIDAENEVAGWFTGSVSALDAVIESDVEVGFEAASIDVSRASITAGPPGAGLADKNFDPDGNSIYLDASTVTAGGATFVVTHGPVNNGIKCAATPIGTTISGSPATGSCIRVYDPNGDDDNDGVVNADDLCQNTPVGVLVDSDGCATNGEDSDGVCDPAATPTPHFTAASNGFAVNVNAGPSSDWDCDLRFEWDWDNDGTWDDGPSTSPIGYHVYPSSPDPGTYQIRLRVYNGDGGPSAVTPLNAPPELSSNSNAYRVTVGSTANGGACIDYDSENEQCGDSGDVAIDVTQTIQNCHTHSSSYCTEGTSIGYIVTDPDHGLVVPSGHGDINLPGNEAAIFAAPKDVVFGSGVRVNGGSNDVVIRSTAGDVYIEGADIRSDNGDIFIEALKGSVYGESQTGATTRLDAKKEIHIDAGTSTMTVGGTINVRDAVLIGPDKIELKARNNNGATDDILMDKARFGSGNIDIDAPSLANGGSVRVSTAGPATDGTVFCKHNQWQIVEQTCKSDKTQNADRKGDATIQGSPKQGTIS